MSEGAPEGQDNSQGNEGGNPAWSEFLSVVPQELHSQVTPLLTKWDQGVQQKINQVHSQYEPYKPFLESKVNPQQIDYALNVLQAIETNPKEVRAALDEWLAEGSEETGEQGQGNSQQGSEQSDFSTNPEFQRVKHMAETMAELLVQQRQESQQTQNDRELADSLKLMHDQHGDFDEKWVLTDLLNSDNPDDLEGSVKAYQQFVSDIRSNIRRPGPKVLGSGGSIPNQELDVTKLDSKGTRGLVQQMLENAARQDQ